MSYADWAFALVVTLASLCTVVCWVLHYVGFKDGHEAGRLYERNRVSLSRLERAENEIWGPLPGPDPCETWLAEITAPGTERLALSGELRRLEIANTGAMAAVTDEYIARMAAEEDAYRQGLAGGVWFNVPEEP
jgi:hypothetical protein